MKRVITSVVCFVLVFVLLFSSVSTARADANEEEIYLEHFQGLIDTFGTTFRFDDFLRGNQPPPQLNT